LKGTEKQLVRGVPFRCLHGDISGLSLYEAPAHQYGSIEE
jgi:hypothetical protein